MSAARIRTSRPTLTRRSSPRSSMRRTVLVDTRSAVAASAMVIKNGTDNGRPRTARAEPAAQCGAESNGAGSLRSNVSTAQEGILSGVSNVDSESALRRDADDGSSTEDSARALPMPLRYSATKTSPIPKPNDFIGRIRH